jgi:tRNA/tmRNA/rRNA uracil-C5-methylase (TrmA/RlmC/RlmD family)
MPPPSDRRARPEALVQEGIDSPEDAELLELETGAIAGGGGCVAHGPDGRVIFVRHSLPGERVVARVTGTTSSFLRADAIEVRRASVDRVSPPCAHSGPGRCGGCDFQHASLAAQRRLKAERVAEQLQRLAGVAADVVVEAVPGDHDGLGWRTRVRLAVDEEGRVGFRRHRSHQLELVDHCPIATQEVMGTGAFGVRWPGVRELEVAVAPDSGDALITVDTPRNARPALPEVHTGLVVNGKARRQPGALHTTVCGFRFRVSPGVFWQVHTGAPDVLLAATRDMVQATAGDTAVDLYAGAGLFSVALASDVGPDGSVMAVERDRHACADAEHNGAALPQLTVRKASITPKLVEHGIGHPDLLVLDPAREGAGQAVMRAIATLAPPLRRVVYVSCDPSSFARDAQVLLGAGWALGGLRAFDIFPMTEHVELVACFEPTVN